MIKCQVNYLILHRRTKEIGFLENNFSKKVSNRHMASKNNI